MGFVEFMRVLGMMMLLVALVSGLTYWIFRLIKKYVPNLKYNIKYKLLRRKHQEEDVEILMDYLDLDVEETDLENDLVRSLLLDGKATPKKAKELLYIYKELKKLQGGDKNGK